MKTKLELDDELLRLAKQRAAAAGISLRAYVEDALRARMLPAGQKRRDFKLELPVVQGKSPPALDVANRDALYDLMDRR